MPDAACVDVEAQHTQPEPAQHTLQPEERTRAPRPPARLLGVLAPLSAFGPLSMDLYLPGMPAMARDLHAGDAYAQLTMSACMVGLATGQLVAGPLSDRFGRRRPAVAGVALFALLSLACALAPTMGVLVGLRLLQGMAGAAGIVVARAVVRDLYDGAAAARVFSLIALTMGLAPVLAPLLGGQLVRFTTWRGLFVALAVIGAAILAVTVAALPESLPPERRRTGGAASVFTAFGPVLRDRAFTGYAAVMALGAAGMFTYISLSSFVLQGTYGLSPQGFSAVFAVNAVGLMVVARLNAVALRARPPSALLLAGVLAGLSAAVFLVVGVQAGWGLWPLLAGLFVVVACTGAISPNATALALAGHAPRAGTAAALLGLVQFLVGGLVAPLASIGGASDRSMTRTIALVLLGGLVVLLVRAPPGARAGGVSRGREPGA